MDGRSFEPSWTTQSKGRPRWNRRRRADGSQGGHWDQRCGRHGPGYHPEMEALHRRHNARLRAIIAAHGWPGYSLVGEDGCRAAGSIVQHAILDPELQRRCACPAPPEPDSGPTALLVSPAPFPGHPPTMRFPITELQDIREARQRDTRHALMSCMGSSRHGT